MNWRRVLLSRFFIVPLVLAVAIVAWNIFVDAHAHGLLEGSVVDASGKPVAGATVILFTHDFVTQVEKAETKSDANGGFRFDGNDSHLIQLQARDGNATSPRVTVRLWFRAQDRVVREPLRIGPPA
jgi:hypothetical protein